MNREVKGWKEVYIKYLHAYPTEVAAKLVNCGLEKVSAEKRIDADFSERCVNADLFRRARVNGIN